MALHTLSIEITIQVLCLVTPDDIASLSLSSRRLYEVVKCHENFICKAIAKERHLRYHYPTSSGSPIYQGMQPLQLLCEQWRRHLLIERIVREIAPGDSRVRRDLWNLWDYQEALVFDIQKQTSDNHRAFVQAISVDELVSMMSTVRKCGSLLHTVTKPDPEQLRDLASDAYFKASKGYEWHSDAPAEIVITKGVRFIVETAIEHKPPKIKELWIWKRPYRKSVFTRLCEEQRLKSKIAALQANALISD